jgi:hypothetical protein
MDSPFYKGSEVWNLTPLINLFVNPGAFGSAFSGAEFPVLKASSRKVNGALTDDPLGFLTQVQSKALLML